MTRAVIVLAAFFAVAQMLALGGTLDSVLVGAGCIRVPLERTADNRMIVRGTLNGEPLALCVDTGSGGTLIDMRRAARFKLVGLKTTRNIFGAVGRTMPTAGTVARSMTLGKLNVGHFPFRVSQLDLNARATGRPVDGVLGMEFLGATHAIIDCMNAVLYFPPPSKFTQLGNTLRAGLLAGHSAEVPLTRMMVMQATVRNQRLELMLDTGSAFTTIDEDETAALHLRPASSPYVLTAIGNQQRRIGTTLMNDLRIGNAPIGGFTVGVSDFYDLNRNLSQQGLPGIQGLFGCELLWLYGGIVDCGNRRLFLTHPNGLPRK